MLLNDTEHDVKSLLKLQGLTQVQAAGKLKVTKGAVNQALKMSPIAPSWVRLVEAIGYDIEIVYRRKE